MAKKPSQQPPDMTVYLTIPREEASSQIVAQVQKGEELKARPISSMDELEDVKRKSWIWSEYNEEMLRQMFTGPRISDEYRGYSFGFPYGDQPLADDIEHLHGEIDSKINGLESVKERLAIFKIAPGVAGTAQAKPQAVPTISNNKVFVVHGHDEGVRETVARYIGKLGLNPIILHEQASEGLTLVEKLERHSDVSYAVVILTPDDVGGETADKLRPRARQNVVMELGYFMGRLERKRVCALYRAGVELPSDYLGVVYVPFDEGDGWRLRLARELKAAGLKVDMNAAL